MDSWAIKKLAKVSPNETPLRTASCKHGKYSKGCLVCTDRRIWWFSKGLNIASSTAQNELSYDLPVEVFKMFFGPKGIAIGDLQFQMNYNEAQDLAQFIRDTRDQMVPLQQQPQQASVADELKKLADLRTQGILSDDEFELKKTQLLQAG